MLYPLVNSHNYWTWPIDIESFPSHSIVILYGYVNVYQMVYPSKSPHKTWRWRNDRVGSCASGSHAEGERWKCKEAWEGSPMACRQHFPWAPLAHELYTDLYSSLEYMYMWVILRDVVMLVNTFQYRGTLGVQPKMSLSSRFLSRQREVSLGNEWWCASRIIWNKKALIKIHFFHSFFL